MYPKIFSSARSAANSSVGAVRSAPTFAHPSFSSVPSAAPTDLLSRRNSTTLRFDLGQKAFKVLGLPVADDG